MNNELRTKLNEDLKILFIDFYDNLLYLLDENLNKDNSNMILDVENFIFEMNKQKNLLTVELKEFIDYYIKYKNK